MKKLLVVMIALVMCITAAACGEKKQAEDLPFKTLGEALELEENTQYHLASYDDKKYVYCFEYEGKPTRVTAEMTKDVLEKYEALDFQAEDYKKQELDLIGGQKVIKVEDLSDQVIPQEELDKYIGKKGSDLVADGFTPNGNEFTEEHTYYTLAKDLFTYDFEFEEFPEWEKDDFDADEAMNDLTVKGVKLSGISDQAIQFD